MADLHAEPPAGDESPLRKETVYEGHIVHLYLETMRLPNGREATLEIIRHKGAVAIVPVQDDGRIVMVRQFRLAAGRRLLEVPAGGLEPGEDPAECAIRELQEEAGFYPGKLTRLGGIYTAPGYTSEYIHLFMATDLRPSVLQSDPDEFLEVVTLSLDEVLGLIERGEVEDGKTIAALLLAARRLAQA